MVDGGSGGTTSGQKWLVAAAIVHFPHGALGSAAPRPKARARARSAIDRRSLSACHTTRARSTLYRRTLPPRPRSEVFSVLHSGHARRRCAQHAPMMPPSAGCVRPSSARSWPAWCITVLDVPKQRIPLWTRTPWMCLRAGHPVIDTATAASPSNHHLDVVIL